MIRPLLLAAALAACSRPAQPPAPTSSPAAATGESAQSAEFTRAAVAQRRQRVMRRAANLSRFPGTDEGAQGFALELARAAASNDPARLRVALDEMLPDDARVELGFTFDGARSLRDRIIPPAVDRADELRARLAALREPLSVSVRSALGQALSVGPQPGMDPRFAALGPQLRPAVRYYRVEVQGTGGSVILEPMAWLGARWTWLGTALPETSPPTPPTTGVATRAGH